MLNGKVGGRQYKKVFIQYHFSIIKNKLYLPKKKPQKEMSYVFNFSTNIYWEYSARHRFVGVLKIQWLAKTKQNKHNPYFGKGPLGYLPLGVISYFCFPPQILILFSLCRLCVVVGRQMSKKFKCLFQMISMMGVTS